MKLKKAFTVLMCLMFVCLAFAGCEFGNKKYTVIVTSANTEMGTVKREPATSDYKKGSEVTIIASANNGFEFVSWVDVDKNNEIVSSNEVYTFKITSNRSFKANFRKIVGLTFDLDGGKTLSGADSIQGKDELKVDDEVPLPILVKTGYIFKGWNDGRQTIAASDDAVYKVPLDSSHNIVLKAVFEAKKYYPILKIINSDNTVVSENYNTDKKYVLTFDQNMLTLPQPGEENMLWEWKRGEDPVVYKKWNEDVSDDTIIFTATVVNAKAFKFLSSIGSTTYTYKISENNNSIVAIETLNVFPSGSLDKVGHKLLGFYDEQETIVDGQKPTNLYNYITYLVNQDDANANKTTDDASKTYKPFYEINSYTVNFDESSDVLDKVEFVSGEEGQNRVIKYNQPFKFLVNAKKQSENPDKYYSVGEVFYTIGNSAEKHIVEKVTIAGTEYYYIANMPASDIKISASANANYTFEFYNGAVKEGENLDLLQGTTKNLPVLDNLTENFVGWCIKVDQSEIKVSDGNGILVTDFWNLIETNYSNVYTVRLYAKWERATKLNYFNFTNIATTENDDLFIMPVAFDNLSNNNLIAFKGANIYQFINKQLTEYNNFNISNYYGQNYEQFADFFYYNITKLFDSNQDGIVNSLTDINNMLVVNKQTNMFVNATVKVYVELCDSTGAVKFDNNNKIITKSQLEQFTDGWTMKIAVSGVA